MPSNEKSVAASTQWCQSAEGQRAKDALAEFGAADAAGYMLNHIPSLPEVLQVPCGAGACSLLSAICLGATGNESFNCEGTPAAAATRRGQIHALEALVAYVEHLANCPAIAPTHSQGVMNRAGTVKLACTAIARLTMGVDHEGDCRRGRAVALDAVPLMVSAMATHMSSESFHAALDACSRIANGNQELKDLWEIACMNQSQDFKAKVQAMVMAEMQERFAQQ
jgi:hypothetical protein